MRQHMPAHPALVDTKMFIEMAHKGQYDRAGVPYWQHPVAVMNLLPAEAPEAWKHAALLHDVIEDTDFSWEYLSAMGYSPEVLEIVRLVTRDPRSTTYHQFIDRIVHSGNVGAMMVKLADLRHNSDQTRAAANPDPEERRTVAEMYRKRYQPAKHKIKAALLALGYGG